jgi:hypothetical protein
MFISQRLTLSNYLELLKTNYINRAKKLGKNKDDAEYIEFKEGIHTEFNKIGIPYFEKGFYGMGLYVYSKLEEVITECGNITDSIHFSNGLAFHNQGIAHIHLLNYNRGVSLIQLAWEEDKKLKHLGAAERYSQILIDRACNLIDIILRKDPIFSFIDAKKLLGRLGIQKYRLMGIILEHKNRIKNVGSLAVIDSAEINIMRICKLIEYHLKIKKNDQNFIELGSLIETFFSNQSNRQRFQWYKEWANWKNKQWRDKTRASSYFKPEHDEKIKDILDSSDDSILKSFKLIYLLRNFTTHFYNEKSILYKRYEECFQHCIKALMYTLHYIY